MALPLAPRENMALTLADSFLNDLDELEADNNIQQQQQQQQQPSREEDYTPSLADDLDELDEEEEAEEEQGVESVVMGLKASGGLRSVSKLRRSARYKQHMEAISVDLPKCEEYEVVVASNDILAKIEQESSLVHQFVLSVYAKRFPELETLVPGKLDYARVAKAIGNETDMTRVDLSDILPPSVVMVVSVTGSTTSGTPLSEVELQDCVDGCDEIDALEADKARVLAYVESRMAELAPNLTALLNSSGLAAILVGMAGGLTELARVPACNLVVMGQTKAVDLAGYSSTAMAPHTGVLFFCDLVQETPAFLQRKALKLVAAKASLASRIDAFEKRNKDTSVVEAMRAEIKSKLDKLQQPPQAQKVKALPPPDIMSGKKKRGGRRVRKAKERLQMTEMRSLANKRAFGLDSSTEYGDDSMGLDLGLLTAAQDSQNLRIPPAKTVKKAAQQPPIKRKMVQLSSGATNGLSSSLVFTPVQGIELADPNAQQAKLKAANERWFSDTSGFQSALPSAPPPVL